MFTTSPPLRNDSVEGGEKPVGQCNTLESDRALNARLRVVVYASCLSLCGKQGHLVVLGQTCATSTAAAAAASSSGFVRVRWCPCLLLIRVAVCARAVCVHRCTLVRSACCPQTNSTPFFKHGV